jgi:hypothetical protein
MDIHEKACATANMPRISTLLRLTSFRLLSQIEILSLILQCMVQFDRSYGLPGCTGETSRLGKGQPYVDEPPGPREGNMIRGDQSF